MAWTGARAKHARKRAESADLGSPISPDLPFIRTVDDLRNHWRVPETGDPVADCELGRAMARRAVEYLRARPEDTGLMGNVFISMIGNGRISGVEIGFGVGLAEALSNTRGGTLI